MFQDIVWSAQSCTLKTFVDSYTLPQLVKVEDGFYSDEEAKTLSAGQIFTLHFTKQTDKLLAQAADHKQYLVPVNCPCKVEILPKICQEAYNSVEDIVDAWTSADFKFIRVVHDGPPSMRIKAGDILKLKKTVEENRVKFLECEFLDKTKDLVRLCLDFKAAFEPLASAGQYQLQEILKTFRLPVRVKFISSDTTIQDADNNIDFPSLGSVLLKELRQETTIIATSRDDGMVTVLMIPTDLDVNVFPARGAVLGEKEYARFCKDVHDGTELAKVDLFENGFKSFETSTVDVIYDYEEVKPPLPPRNRRESKESEHSDSSDDYEDVKLPPRLPPKPPPKPKPKPQRRPMPASPYQNVQDYDVLKAPKESPSNFEEASPHHHNNNGSNDGADDDDEDLYLSSGFDSDEDYIYPETEPNHPSDSDLEAQQEKPNLGEKSKTIQIKKRLSGIFKKALPKSPSLARSRFFGYSQGASDATSSPQGQDLAPSSPTPLASNPYTSLPTTGAELPQAFPDDLRCLSVQEVGECLRKLNMGDLVEKFERDQIDGELFVMLDENTLPYLGVSDKFQQKKLLMFVNGWRPNT